MPVTVSNASTNHLFPSYRVNFIKKIEVRDYTGGAMKAMLNHDSLNNRHTYKIYLNKKIISLALIKRELSIKKITKITFEVLFSSYAFTLQGKSNSTQTFYINEKDHCAYPHPVQYLSPVNILKRFTFKLLIEEPSVKFYNYHGLLYFSINNNHPVLYLETVYNQIKEISFCVLRCTSKYWALQSEDKETCIIYYFTTNECEINFTKAIGLEEEPVTVNNIMQQYTSCIQKLVEEKISEKLTRLQPSLPVPNCVIIYNGYCLLLLGIESNEIVLYYENLIENRYFKKAFSIMQCTSSSWAIQVTDKKLAFHYNSQDDLCYIEGEKACKAIPTSAQESANDTMQHCTWMVKELFKAIIIKKLTRIQDHPPSLQKFQVFYNANGIILVVGFQNEELVVSCEAMHEDTLTTLPSNREPNPNGWVIKAKDGNPRITYQSDSNSYHINSKKAMTGLSIYFQQSVMVCDTTNGIVKVTINQDILTLSIAKKIIFTPITNFSSLKIQKIFLHPFSKYVRIIMHKNTGIEKVLYVDPNNIQRNKINYPPKELSLEEATQKLTSIKLPTTSKNIITMYNCFGVVTLIQINENNSILYLGKPYEDTMESIPFFVLEKSEYNWIIESEDRSLRIELLNNIYLINWEPANILPVTS